LNSVIIPAKNGTISAKGKNEMNQLSQNTLKFTSVRNFGVSSMGFEYFGGVVVCRMSESIEKEGR